MADKDMAAASVPRKNPGGALFGAYSENFQARISCAWKDEPERKQVTRRGRKI